jgi:hypothetical protein
MYGKLNYLQDPRDQSLEPKKTSHPLHHQHISNTLKIIIHCNHYLLTHVIILKPSIYAQNSTYQLSLRLDQIWEAYYDFIIQRSTRPTDSN